MRAENKKILRGSALTGILGAALFLFSSPAQSQSSPSLQHTIHEAENLSLNKDRLLACGVLWRNIKKANKADAKILKEKLLQLSRYYYTDKGFQAFLVGKELFQKQKYQDAQDKFLEADDLEAGNVEVLHYLTLTQLWLKRPDQAEATNKKAAQMCPVDIEIVRDSLAIQVVQESWKEAQDTAATLTREHLDTSGLTIYYSGLAALKSDKMDEAKKNFEQTIQKDPLLPEPYYWLATLKPSSESLKLLTKYVELCKNRTPPQERDVGACVHLQEAEKKMSL